MLHAFVQLFLYALLAGLSALALTATIAVMQAGRLKALGFAAGFVLGQALTCSAFVIVGVAVTGAGAKTHSSVQASAEVLVALFFIWLALRIRRRPPAPSEGTSERAQALLERLRRLRFSTTAVAGFLLGIGGPKRLLLTAFAATAVTAAGVTSSREAALVLWYVALATLVVWGPILLFELLGERTVGLMSSVQAPIARHQPEIKVYVLLLLAAGLLVDALTIVL
jgi:hypothetical protein